jgi:hypothetical protein
MLLTCPAEIPYNPIRNTITFQTCCRSFPERKCRRGFRRRLAALPTDAVIFAMMAGTAPEAAVFPIEKDGIYGTAGAVVEG